MKKLFGVLLIILPLICIPVAAKEATRTKAVCEQKQKCKELKIHKKFDGKKVPQQAKKK